MWYRVKLIWGLLLHDELYFWNFNNTFQKKSFFCNSNPNFTSQILKLITCLPTSALSILTYNKYLSKSKILIFKKIIKYSQLYATGKFFTRTYETPVYCLFRYEKYFMNIYYSSHHTPCCKFWVFHVDCKPGVQWWYPIPLLLLPTHIVFTYRSCLRNVCLKNECACCIWTYPHVSWVLVFLYGEGLWLCASQDSFLGCEPKSGFISCCFMDQCLQLFFVVIFWEWNGHKKWLPNQWNKTLYSRAHQKIIFWW